jgi:hypothetical protein
MKSQPYDPNNPNATGCILGEPNDVYHANKAVSHSKLWTFHKRPKDYEGRHITGELENPPKECLITGSASHSILLEPYKEFQANYACLRKELNWRKTIDKIDAIERYAAAKGVKMSKEEIEELAKKKREEIEVHFHLLPGRTILRPDQMDLIRRIRDNIRAHPEAGDMLKEGVGEVTFRSPMLKLGYQVQSKFDWLNLKGCVHSEGRSFGADIKTIQSLTRWDSEKVRRGYYRAYPFYTKVQEISVGERIIKDWFFIVVEKEWPFSVMVKRPDQAMWDRGMREIDSDMKHLAKCLESGHFPDPGDGGITWDTLPDYMLSDRVPEPGIRVGDPYVPDRDYEYAGGWSTDR